MAATNGRARPRLEPAPGLALWREAFLGLDWVSLRTSAVYYGFGVPRGDGSPVVVVPGFLGSDRYLMEMYYWLERIGYRPYYSNIGSNTDCPNLLLDRLLQTVDRAYAETGATVRLVGHSLGGTMSRAAAVRRPRRISQVITLGSPLQFARVHPAVLMAASVIRGRILNNNRDGSRRGTCYTDACTCGFASSIMAPQPPAVARTSVFTKGDGVVDWHCCLDEDPDANIEVKGTHVGLAFNPQAYRTVARALAAATARASRSNGHRLQEERPLRLLPRRPARRRVSPATNGRRAAVG